MSGTSSSAYGRGTGSIDFRDVYGRARAGATGRGPPPRAMADEDRSSAADMSRPGRQFLFARRRVPVNAERDANSSVHRHVIVIGIYYHDRRISKRRKPSPTAEFPNAENRRRPRYICVSLYFHFLPRFVGRSRCSLSCASASVVQIPSTACTSQESPVGRTRQR